MKTQLEMMVTDCERSLLSGQFQFSKEWLDNLLMAAKELPIWLVELKRVV